MRPLLAKSYNINTYPNSPPQYALLTQHSRDVAAACNALVETIGLQCLQNAGLSSEMLPDLRLALILNGWIQDIGKANSHFQRMLKEKGHTQLIRHEVLSTILFWTRPELKTWLSDLPESIRLSAIWGALGHHRKFDQYYEANDTSDVMTVFLTHPDFGILLSELGQNLELSTPPTFSENLCLARRPSASEPATINAISVIRQLLDEFSDLEDRFDQPSNRRFLALVKTLGIAADVCASAIAIEQSKSGEIISIADAIQVNLGSVGLSEQNFSTIIANRLANSNVTVVPDSRIAFQKEVSRSASQITLVEAGCGSGKSIAAYEWGAQCCKRATIDGRKNFRFFFCLPTTGTTTEHFKDYALECGIDPSLMSLTHSKASVDLQTLTETTEEEDIEIGGATDTKSLARACLKATRDKIESLALWSTPLVVTTADTILGTMVNARRSVYSLPAIMNAAIVFDECHAFDDQMFKLLLAFIKNFPNIPTLLMTASLPKERRQALIDARPDLLIIPGPKKFEEQPRYLPCRSPDQSNNLLARVKACVAEGGKVLWVRNQVQWANAKYKELLEVFPNMPNIDVYHSRLKYEHRSKRHRRVIDQFKDETAGFILVATQVAEMSLDLSADLLITDMAPIPALIQRMGRLNRKATPSAVIQPNLIVLPLPEKTVAPYELDELNHSEAWMRKLKDLNRLLNQRDLSAEFETIGKGRSYDLASAEKDALFFSGLWQTRPGLTRKTGYTMSVILQEDHNEWIKLNKSVIPDRDWLRNHEVAIPLREEMSKWPKIGHMPVAPSASVSYDYIEATNTGTGAEWK